MSLAGRTVLVPRGGARGRAWAREIEAHGGRAVVAPLVEVVPPADDAPLAAAVADLAAGLFDWVALTSVNAVHALVERGADLGRARLAAVGEVTADAVREAGADVALVPERRTAAGLVEAWAAMLADGAAGAAAVGTPARVLLPLSALAAPTLERGLAGLGLLPVRVDAYDLTDVAASPEVRTAVATGTVDAAIVSSGSVARRVAAELGPFPPGFVVACIGEPSAAVAREVGLPVAVVAGTSTGAGTVAALATHYHERQLTHPPLDREDQT